MASIAPRGSARQTLGQLVRYGVTGGAITIGFSAFYLALTELGGVRPAWSLTIAFLVFSVISYVGHSRVSFRGHGGRDNLPRRTTLFFLVNLIGFGLNQFWTWLLVAQMGGPSWWPVVPFTFVTPLVTFLLHRRWVYN